MAKLVTVAETPSTKQVVEEKKTTTTEIPRPTQAQILRPGAMGAPPKNPSINEWWNELAPDERGNEYTYTLYRDDSRIIIVEENLDDRASGSMLYKFKDDEIRTFPQGAFLQELAQWCRPRYGGGDFHIMINHRKSGKLRYNKGFKIEGQPILSKREDWLPGQAPGMLGGGGEGSVLPMLMKLMDDKLAAVTANRQEPGAAVAEVTKAIMESNTAAYQWLVNNMPKPPDPTAHLDQMRVFFSLLKEIQPSAPALAAADPSAQFLQFANMMKAVRELDAPRESPTSLKDVIAEAVKTAVREVGGLRRSGGTDWGALVEKFAPVLIPLATGALGRLQGRGSAPQPANVQAPPLARQSPFNAAPGAASADVGTNYNPAFQRRGPGGMPRAPENRAPGFGGYVPPNGAQAAPEPPPLPAAVPDPSGPIMISEEVQSAVLWNHATQQIADMVTHDETGDVAAAALEAMFPAIAVHIRGMNEESLKVMIQADPVLSKIKDDPRLPAFITAFLAYFQEQATPQ